MFILYETEKYREDIPKRIKPVFFKQIKLIHNKKKSNFNFKNLAYGIIVEVSLNYLNRKKKIRPTWEIPGIK